MKSLLGGYFFQPASEKQFSSLTAKVELLKNKYPDSYQKKKSTKILAAIRQIIITSIYRPDAADFQAGKDVGRSISKLAQAEIFPAVQVIFSLSDFSQNRCNRLG